MKLLNIPKINNVHRTINYIVNNVSATLVARSYTLTELINYFLALPNTTLINGRLNCNQILSLRFNTQNDKNMFLTLFGFEAELTRELNVSLRGTASYEPNVNFNSIVEIRYYNDLSNYINNDFIVANPFGNNFITTIPNNAVSYKLYNIYLLNEEVNSVTKLVIVN
jgi:hypothetical protein